MANAEERFEAAFKTLETQIAETTQFWFAARAINEIAKSNDDTLMALNETPTFWLTVRVGLEYQGIISAGKIFGNRKKNPHNIDSFFQVLRECHARGVCARRARGQEAPEFSECGMATGLHEVGSRPDQQGRGPTS